MGETLESLYRLQQVERQLAQFRLRREEKLRQIDSRQLQVKKTEDQLEQNKELALRRQVLRWNSTSRVAKRRSKNIARL